MSRSRSLCDTVPKPPTPPTGRCVAIAVVFLCFKKSGNFAKQQHTPPLSSFPAARFSAALSDQRCQRLVHTNAPRCKRFTMIGVKSLPRKMQFPSPGLCCLQKCKNQRQREEKRHEQTIGCVYLLRLDLEPYTDVWHIACWGRISLSSFPLFPSCFISKGWVGWWKFPHVIICC